MHEINQLKQSQGIPIQRLCDALQLSRATLYRHNTRSDEVTVLQAATVLSANALSSEQQQTVLELLHSERFVDSTPYEVFYTLLDEESRYYCSIRTMYRLLEARGESNDRRAQRSHRDAVKPELMATAPNQVWTWDITKLLSEHRLVYYHLYVILDIFSRYVIGWLIADREDQALAKKLIQHSTLKHNIQPGTLCLHSDNGPSMTSGTVAQLLDHLNILKSHNRPYTSNDNPFSESQFKTLKYCPEFPKRFTNMAEAERFCQRFFKWYNTQHYHSGIAWLTPSSVHYGDAEAILEKRHQVMMNAYEINPARFNYRAPKLQQLSEAVYINPPEKILDSTPLQQEKSMA